MSVLKELLARHQLSLPRPPNPVGAYQASVVSGSYLYISGQLPIKSEEVVYKGKLGTDLTTAQGVEAAELCALNVLGQVDAVVPIENIKQLVKVEGFVNCCESFGEHASVLNGASGLFSKVLADKSGHIRTALGCSSLPLGAAVEVSAIFELS